MSVTSVAFAKHLHEVLGPHLPAFPSPPSVKRPSSEPRKPHSLNSNIRVYKYTESQHFGPHYDDSVRDEQTGAKSEWTLLIYLTGEEDGVQGGEVRPAIDKLVRVLSHRYTRFTDVVLQGAEGKASRNYNPSLEARDGTVT